MEGAGFKTSAGYNPTLLHDSVPEEKYERICDKMLM